MQSKPLLERTEAYLSKLCIEIPTRQVGSEGNQAATNFFASIMKSFGFEVEMLEFDCIDWLQDGVDLEVNGLRFEAFPSPYSLGCQVLAPLAVVTRDEDLETADISGKIILLQGEIAREQLMPKNFPFYNPDRHRRIIQILEAKKPQAVIAATSRDVEMVGAQYPFPLFEDGDFDIPSVYMTDEEGIKLAEYVGKLVHLESRTTRIPSRGCNVISFKGKHPEHRIVLFAHIDARMGSPGAGDNASGIVTLLLLAELLEFYSGDLGIEIVALNGEDYYSNPGEQLYLSMNTGKFNRVILGINLDDVGYYKGNLAYSTYDCSESLLKIINKTVSPYPEIIMGEPWYQGDHGLFLMNQIPALAFTSELLAELMAEITHTPRDLPDYVDPAKLVKLALALRDLISEFNGSSALSRMK